jgi:Domain of unknown function (DUF4430)
MSKPLAALLAAFVLVPLAVPCAQAAPAEVSVRIEGKAETLFEGPVLTDGHNVKGLTDTEAPPWGRRCNGLNNGANPTPGPTPTAAAVDAMAIVGEGFDGDWYGAESFDDYFVTQWGPERQNVGEGDYWGVVVNNVFASVGGCQYQVDAGDEVLWVYDAFDGRPQLVLYPADYSGGSVQLTAKATLGVPFEVTVEEWGGDCCTSSPPPSPTRSANPFEGAEVAPVVSTVRGFERADTASDETVETGSDGTATIAFDTPGWHRIKATATAAGEETAIRSNRLDVCVPDPPATDCGPPPADDQVRQPPPSDLEPEPGPEKPEEGPGVPSTGGGQPKAPALGPPTPEAAPRTGIAPRGLDRSRIAAGIVGVSWQVRDEGAGVARWRVSSKTLGRRGARFLTRATGRSKSSAQVRLPRGARCALRLALTDLLGRSSSVSLGTVRVPA